MSLPLAASSSSEISLQKRMGQFHFQQLSVCSTSFMPLVSMSISNPNLGILRKIPVVNCSTNNPSKFIEHLKLPLLRPPLDLRARLVCRMSGSGAGANLVSWLVLPRNAVSVGASGAVFGLFAISVLVKMSWDWRKILEVLILGQFVIEKVMEAAQASTAMSGSVRVGNSINHIAHLSGALVGVFLVWLLSKIPSELPEQGASYLPGKRNLHP